MGYRILKAASLALFSLLLAPLAHGALPFATAPAQYREVNDTYATEAQVEAVQQSTVSAQISGRIVEINFDVGDRVKKGQVLVRIDPSEVNQSLAVSQAQLAQAQAGFQNAKSHYERSQQLFARKFISQAALDKATADYKAAEAQMRAAQAGAGLAATTKSFATVLAPYTGIVMARHVELGETATPGKPLMTGFDPRELRAVASIPQYKMANLSGLSRAQVEFPALGKRVDATKVTVQPAADFTTHVTRVRIGLPEGLQGVYPGMFARAYFEMGRVRKLLVPASAVVRRGEVTAVYAVDAKGGVTLRQVRLGEPTGEGAVEVLAGVVAGESVALDPIKAGMYLKSVRGKE